MPNPFGSSKFQSSEGGLNQSKENKEFFQQLLNWQENPSQLLDTLKQMKEEQMGLGQKEEFIEEKMLN